jgi:hypothetical protein
MKLFLKNVGIILGGSKFRVYPCGPGYPFIRLQALGTWPVSTTIPYTGGVVWEICAGVGQMHVVLGN